MEISNVSSNANRYSEQQKTENVNNYKTDALKEETISAMPKASLTQAQEQNTNYGQNGEGLQHTEQKLNAAIDHVNNKIRVTNTKCEFSYHDDTNRISIRVIDKETNEVVREIPAEETLEMLSKMWEIAGLMVDEKR